MPTQKSKGFTLIELLVVISILGILSTVGFVIYSNAQLIGRDAKRKSDLRSIKQALELYWGQNKTFMPLINANNDSATSNSSPPWIKGLTPNYIDQLPVDPLNSGTRYYSLWFNVAQSAVTPCPGKGGFAIFTQLENPKDTEAVRSSMPLCMFRINNNDTYQMTVNPGMFIIFND